MRQCFDQLHAASFRWDAWAAGYLIGGSCSDDAFMDFRAGLVARGGDVRPGVRLTTIWRILTLLCTSDP
ncbi:DUF4240 domain-containing protein [Streptomyces sp. MMG1121]|uniref:DUF4240 domain-containing protein n=1 Tax=Streptomyces sp. MMG1121 TaxID=1415544 RepID=UPI00099D1105|nr:DUF4240 domain-containing protein [Streptomyces sp. MMG1121]